MGVILNVGLIIAEVVLIVAEVVWWVIETIGIFLWEMIQAVAYGVATAAEWTWAALEAIGINMAAGIETVINEIGAFYRLFIDPWVTPIAEFIGDLTAPLIDVAKALHLREIFLVHSIMLQLSAEYHRVMTKWLEGLSKLSSALQLGFGVLESYIQFTHSTMVTLGAISGHSFATSELRFLSETNKWMGDVSQNLNYYEHDPARLFVDVNTQVIEPLVNQSAENQTALYDNLLRIQGVADKAVTRAGEIDAALANWAESAPVEWRDDIRRSVEPVRDELRNFRGGEWIVWRNKFNAAVKELEVTRDAIRAEIDMPGIMATKSLRKKGAARRQEADAWDKVLGDATARALARV